MIQDILPRHLDNQFRWLTPQKSDIILLFEGSSVLAKWQDEKFIILITKNSAHRQMRQNTRLFMYCLSMKSSIFWQCAKEKCWRVAFRESFPMRKCMRNIKANQTAMIFQVSISSAVPYRNTGHLQRLRHIIYMAGTVTTVSAADAENRWYTIKRNAWCDACAATIWCSRKFVRR